MKKIILQTLVIAIALVINFSGKNLTPINAANAKEVDLKSMSSSGIDTQTAIMNYYSDKGLMVISMVSKDNMTWEVTVSDGFEQTSTLVDLDELGIGDIGQTGGGIY